MHCRASVLRLSFCPSMNHSRNFAAGGPTGMRYRSIAARRTAAGECGQCHVVSVRSSSTETCFACPGFLVQDVHKSTADQQ